MMIKPGYWVACALSVAVTAVPPLTPAVQAFNPDEQTRIDLYETASPAVVTLDVGQGAGSGSIIDATGLVLTNDHVIQGAPRGRLVVITSEGDRYPAQVIAVDRANDLALVQILSTRRFPTIPFASMQNVRVGQEVYAIGSPFGLSGTLTTGILSRIAPNGDLQTDAAINPGNSGGPLLNSKGELIGVNKAILTPSRGNVGIGFATNLQAVEQLIARSRDQIIAARNLAQQPAPSAPPPAANPIRLGVAMTPDLIIQGVELGSIAAQVGLRPGDRIIAINQQRIRSVDEILRFLSSDPDVALLTIARNRRVANIPIRF